MIECQPRAVCGYQTILLTFDGSGTHDLVHTNWSTSEEFTLRVISDILISDKMT